MGGQATIPRRLKPVAQAATRCAVLLALVVLADAVTTGVVHAHAAFVSSQPEPGQRLPNAPGVVVLRFTEPINVKLSRTTVTGPNGQHFEGSSTGQQEIQVRLASNAPGVYDVAWTTVSTVDGHTLQGSFRFGVRVAPGEGAEGGTAITPQRSDLLIAIARTLEYAALLTAVGMLLLRRLARREPALAWVRPRLNLALMVAFLSGTGVVLGEAFSAAPSPSSAALGAYLATGPAGAARLARLAAEGVAVSLSTYQIGLATVPLAVAIIGLAAAGHAAAVPPAWSGIGVDALHLLAAGLWAGGILALATVRPPAGWRGAEAWKLLERFTPIALAAFILTIATGAARGLQELGHLDDLLTSSYGQVLTIKVIAVLGMVPLSVQAWRRRHLWPRIEAGVAAFVIGAAALLAAFPLPPGRLGEAEAARAPATASALPEENDLTLGGEAGDALVGLSLRPGGPGRNDVLIYPLPLEGEAASADTQVSLTFDAHPLGAERCGPVCWRTAVDLQGGERFEVNVAGAKGGTAVFQLPAFPAPDGTRLLEGLQERMHALRTMRVDEVLGPATPPVETVYAFQAPDRMRLETSSGFATVWLGGTRYMRNSRDAPWQVEQLSFSLPVPSFVWDATPGKPDLVPFVAPRIIGTADLDGVQTQVLAFFAQQSQIPVWFKLWVDPDGLVRRAEMRAQGHFMDERYSDFDAPFSIQPPVP